MTGPSGPDPLRRRFLARLGFDPDPFQLQAFDALDAGHNVLVSAPTGSGKTLVADYAVAGTLEAGRRAFYTTPLKALSNQKLGELAATYGSGEVGLLTGDVSHQPGAPVVVMTTEVLRNMLFSDPGGLADLGLVVLDEVHFLQDAYRGSVWEEVLILCPPTVRFVCLSATVSNAEELGGWIASVRGPTDVVVERTRPVELRNHLALADRRRGEIELVPLFRRDRLNPELAELERRVARQRARGGPNRTRLGAPRRSELVEVLGERGMLPAIVFIFSRAGCDEAVEQCRRDGLRLGDPTRRAEIRRRCEAHTEGIDDDDLRALHYGTWSSALEAGLGAHHAGLVPAFRETVEDCFADGLLEVVFATETLALGVNMPARTVVVERLSKMRAGGRSDLSSGEYAQLTGRAGRRGIDRLGHAVVCFSPHVVPSALARLAASPAPDLRSSFRPSYNLAVNLVRRVGRDQAHYVLDRSFAQFQDRRHHHALSRQMDHLLGLLDHFGHVDLAGWRLRSRGELLARIYHESDLLVAEALARGLFDGLQAPELAAVLSACTYESRPGRPRWPARLPPAAAEGIAALAELAGEIRAEEHDARVPRTRLPDDGFAEAAWRWGRGERLEDILARVPLAAGDFVRNVKQLADLVHQVGLVSTVAATAEAARTVAARLQRGVVVSGSAPGLAAGDADA